MRTVGQLLLGVVACTVDLEQVRPLRDRELRLPAAQPALGFRDGHTLAGSPAVRVGLEQRLKSVLS